MTAIVKELPNYAKGTELLRKAVTREKEASRYYAQYVQWVAAHNVPLQVIAKHFMAAKGWTLQPAQRSARAVIMLNDSENKKHLEDLMTGMISFPLAVMLVHSAVSAPAPPANFPVGPEAQRESARRDDETAREYLRIVVNIVRRHHREWGIRDFLDWVSEVTLPILAYKTKPAARKSIAPAK